ncbi:MAG: gamma carbonic anhydrase family protein [Bradyrhizobiaceae bacterium]|nr:MAG: gamma carbonic anhydrase family protein [Bradyrhizobiaceae bacterium]
MQQSRKQLKQLKEAARNGNAQAAKLLLAHSVALGHNRLSVARFFQARALGAEGLEQYHEAALAAASRIPPDIVLSIAQNAVQGKALRPEIRSMIQESMVVTAPYILPYGGIQPSFVTHPLISGHGSSVLGKVSLGANATLGPAAVLRADGHFVKIGDDFSIGRNSTVHIAHELYPTIVGDRVAVGKKAVVHACVVGNDCLIEDNVVILDGSVVEQNVLIEANSTVYPRAVLKANSVYAGSPAKFVRELTTREHTQRKLHLLERIAGDFITPQTEFRHQPHEQPDAFVARTAILSGHVDLRSRSSVFYSCVLSGGQGSIIVHENTNIQDNSRLECHADGIIVGQNTTIGHNVTIRDARIGAQCLIGIGSHVNAGTVIEDDVLLAAGSTTEMNQRLEGGYLWAGRPARQLGKLNDAKRKMMGDIIGQYCDYADAYKLQQ